MPDTSSVLCLLNTSLANAGRSSGGAITENDYYSPPNQRTNHPVTRPILGHKDWLSAVFGKLRSHKADLLRNILFKYWTVKYGDIHPIEPVIRASQPIHLTVNRRS